MSAQPRRFLSTGTNPAEKSKFVQTCNRLSLFLKENGDIGDLNFGINTKFDATEASAAETTTIDLLRSIGHDTGEKTLEKLKLKNSPPPAPPTEYVILDSSRELTNRASTSSAKPKTAPMTIFYGGKVIVVDDVPADRVRDLMLMAKPKEKFEKNVELASTSKVVSGEAKDSDLPIARRASLHKFLAKRKDRRASPYQTNAQSPGGSTSGNEHSFDLNK
ncbi:protein TIFY 10A-like [Bidens hawaiensis]|uniref:protein TIFY 10A-like n=1 Tax=Bidens hawaiensis TaxID=980011 RepID=UPI004048F1E4